MVEYDRPVVRGTVINMVWDTIYECIFNLKITPPLTFEEVQILQNRLDEHIESTKFKIQMKWALETDDEGKIEKKPPDALYL